MILNDPTKGCIVKGKKSAWKGLPQSKSLFHAKANCGLPIGNLTSQLFGNIYLNEFDHWVKRELKINCYGRYVDDFILMHESKEYLKSLVPRIKVFLKEHLKLLLHPGKIYLQHFSKGVHFLGSVIKPHRIYIGNRAKGNFSESVQHHNALVRERKPTWEEKERFISTMNSYLGIMKHYKTYKLRQSLLCTDVSAWWWNYAYASNDLSKLVLKQRRIMCGIPSMNPYRVRGRW